MNIHAEYRLGDMALIYVTDERGTLGLLLAPWDMRESLSLRHAAPDSLVQLYVRGDALPNSYANGHTLAWSGSTAALRLAGQEQTPEGVVTMLNGPHGLTVIHRVVWHEGLRALRVTTEAVNGDDAPVTLELLSSVSLCGLTPFAEDDACGRLFVHRARSAWSAEGRWTDEAIEDLQLERSWTGHAARVERFGQVGSMPVRGWFPFLAVEDRAAGVTWAMQLACPSSWQMELRRKDDALCMTAGLADYDYGHWSRTLAPGEAFTTPEAIVTCAAGDPEQVAQRLLDMHRENWVGRDKPLPVIFNEYCTTWGSPTHGNMVRLSAALQGHDVDYVVMDAGWYGREGAGWSDCGGDWIPDARMFPQGLKATADAIREAGFLPGIWFEPETCAHLAEVFSREDMLLRRNGAVIDTDNRRFLDLRTQAARDHLQHRMTDLLRDCGFAYLKVDYNDAMGVGCDSPDGMGEGLRQHMQETLALFRRVQEQVPGLMLENCASGGHRLEPSLLGASWLSSFSDAHECAEIPVIAANLHRLMLPGQSLIWAVLRPEDTLRRITYSMTAAMLGVVCLSGDIYNLSAAQWDAVDRALLFYRNASDVIRDGESAIIRHLSSSWRHPEGWQAVIRRMGDRTLVLVHTFGGPLPEQITLETGGTISSVLCSEGNRISLEEGRLTITLHANFEGIAVLLN